ncbi:hypothetical protein SAXI111661_01975 [Saccharomonospora xinjiangensis]|nr:hypothetical protein EYD13_18750 [Saccharomonospora xinjiangensis]
MLSLTTRLGVSPCYVHVSAACDAVCHAQAADT